MKRLLLLLALSANASFAADSISITSPSGNPTWTGWTGNNFTVSYSGADIALVCFQVDAYPALNPGPAGVISGNAGGFLAAGCENLPPFTFHVDTFQWLDGPHQVVATAYDILGNVVATSSSSPATFTIGNTWPVSCPGPPILSVSTSIATTSTWHDQVTATATISGDCVGDSFTYYWTLDGVPQNYSQPSITFDTTSVLNGSVVVGLMVLDPTNGFSYNAGALEWTRTVTVNNTAGPTTKTEVRGNARELFLELGGSSGGNCDAAAPTVGSCTFIPTLYYGDQTPVSSPTFYYYATNSNATITGTSLGGSPTIYTGSSATISAATLGNDSIVVAGITQSGNDGVGNTNSFSSPSYTGRPSDVFRTLWILGGTNCIVGPYTIQSVSSAGHFTTYTAAPPYGITNFVSAPSTNCQWALGPTRTIYAYSDSGVPTVAHDSACGSNLTAYVATGPCASRFTASIFTSGGITSEFTAQPYPVAYGQSYANSGYNTVESSPFSSSLSLAGTQAAFVTSEQAYLTGSGTGQTAYISPWPVLRLIGTMDSWISPSPLLQIEFGSASSANWPGGGSSGVPSGVAGAAGTMNYLAKQTNMYVKLILHDEITAQGWPGAMPLAGPIQPGPSTVQNWLNSITASSGTCTATTYTSPIPSGGYGLGSTFIITSSVTANMNSVYPALYTVNAINATSFSFTCTGVANGTYNSSTDPGLTIQQYGKYGWIVNNLTSAESYMNWDAFASFANQMRSIPGGHVPFGGSYQGQSPYWALACFGNSVSGCGQSINTANTGGNTVSNLSDVNDANTTHGTMEYFLRARQNLNSIVTDWFTASLEMGYRFRNLVNILNPAVSLTIIGQGLSTDSTYNGAANQYTVVSCVGKTITFGSNHNITNIQPGTSRLWISGSTDPNCNNNFYIIAAPTPITLWVVYAATQTTCAAGSTGACAYHNAASATLTFANGDKIGVGATLLNNQGNPVPLYEISASGLTKVMGGDSTIFNYGTSLYPNNGCGTLSNPLIASNAVTRDRGLFFNISGVTGTGASYFNSTTFYYDIENLSTPSDEGGGASACFNYFREVPVLSGTGGTAQIQPDNLHVRGREEDDFIAGNTDPDTSFGNGVECQILRCAGQRFYEAEQNPQSYTPVAVTDPAPSLTLHKAGFGSSNGAIFNPAWSTTDNQIGIHPNAESHYSVPDWKGGSFVSMMGTRTQKFRLGSTPTNCPDYDQFMDSCAFKGNAAGNLLIVGNFTNGPQTRTVALCSDVRNLCTSGQSIIRYIADARGIYAVTVIAAGTMNDIGLTLQQGQAAWYTFPATFAGELNQPAPIPQLIPGSTGVAYRYAYDPYYLDSNPTGVFDCGSAATPCVLPIDLNIGQPGTHPYRVIYYKTVGGQKIVLNVGDIQYF